MRGDSLRDLYAKVIAVLGLGVLAGAGALVDYWPNNGALPRVAAAVGDTALAGPLPVPTAAVQVAETRQPAPRAARFVNVAARTTLPARTAPQLTSVANEFNVVAALAAPAASLPAPPPVPVSVPALPAPAVTFASLSTPPATVETARAQEAWSITPDRTAWIPVVDASRAGMPSAAGSEDDGFFMGAVKKTRDSIVRTGRKTGTSIFDAFRAVSGAMKKALPG